MATDAPLKRLGFVQGYAGSAVTIAENVYKTARGFVPGMVEPYVRQAEDKATHLAAPYLTWAQDTAEKVLRTADGQVDYGVTSLTGALNFSRDLHDKNMTTFKDAKDQYYALVEKTFSGAKSKLDPTPVLSQLLEFVRATLDKAIAYTDPDFVVDTAVGTVSKVASNPLVAKALEVGQPAIGFATKQYASAHDTVVSMPVYKKAYSTVEATAKGVTDMPVYKKALDTVYPVVAPVADPVIANISKSKYVAQLVAHIKPAAIA